MKKVSSWRELSLREKIGQTVVCTCKPDEHIKMCGSVEAFLKKYPIGGIFNNGAYINGLDTGENEGFKALVEEYNSYLSVPMFTVADNGIFARKNNVNISCQMAVGAANNEALAYKMMCYTSHYRNKLNFTWEALENSQNKMNALKAKLADEKKKHKQTLASVKTEKERQKLEQKYTRIFRPAGR